MLKKYDPAIDFGANCAVNMKESENGGYYKVEDVDEIKSEEKEIARIKKYDPIENWGEHSDDYPCLLMEEKKNGHYCKVEDADEKIKELQEENAKIKKEAEELSEI